MALCERCMSSPFATNVTEQARLALETHVPFHGVTRVLLMNENVVQVSSWEARCYTLFRKSGPRRSCVKTQT